MENTILKKCNNPDCIHGNELQPIENFYKNKKNQDGYDGYCKDCVKKRHRKYREDNIEIVRKMVREAYYNNKEYYIEKHKAYHDAHKEETKLKREELALWDRWSEVFKSYPEEIFRRSPENNLYIEFACKYCGGFFIPTNNQLIHRLEAIRGSSDNRFRNNFIYCSDACKSACPAFRRVGEGQLPKNNTSREVPSILRKIVLELDDWTCQLCGASKYKDRDLVLHVHHEKSYNLNPIFAADPDNCITVCNVCHNWIHHLDGCGYNDLKCK